MTTIAAVNSTRGRSRPAIHLRATMPPLNCEGCGELVRIPTETLCSDCSGETRHLMTQHKHNRDQAYLADMQYHGGLGNRGEW